MNNSQLLRLRMYNTGLTNSPFKLAADAVSHLGAVQAQDYAAAKWALGMRMKNATDVEIEQAFNEGKILRTHVLRPTWHFVMPEHIGWMLKLTAPRIKEFMKSYDKKLELSESLYSRTNKAIIKTLSQQPLATRQELKNVLSEMRIETDVQRLAHVVMRAELDGLICSGPRQGKQFTYTLLENRAPVVNSIDKEEAMANLANLYFTSHGPAQLKDFSWWSGLKANGAAHAHGLIQSKLEKVIVGGKEFWFVPIEKIPGAKSPMVRLVSVYDEYTIAYKDREMLSVARDIEHMLKMGSLLTAVIILDGVVAGTWKRILKKNKVEVKLNPFRKFTKEQKEALMTEVERHKRFILAH